MSYYLKERSAEHITFVKVADQKDRMLANFEFSPKRHHVEILNYYKVYSDRLDLVVESQYQHRDFQFTNSSNIYEDYYVSKDGVQLYFRIEFAQCVDTRNKVIFGCNNHKKLPKQIKNYVAKLRRLAKNANKKIQGYQFEFYQTLEGAQHKLDQKICALLEKIENDIGYDYKKLSSRTGGNYFCTVYQNEGSDMIARISFNGIDHYEPVLPNFVVFFEDRVLHEEHNEKLKQLDPYIRAVELKITEHNKDLVVARLKGEF